MNLTSTLTTSIRGASTKKVEILSMSDIHLGHHNTPAQHIIRNLDVVICDSPEFAVLDLLLLCGDVFDRLLSLPEEDVYAIRAWVKRVLLLCRKHKVALRILEGTPRHDRRQSRIFTEIQQTAEIELDMRYVDVLEIEYHAPTGLNILYIPDEWRHLASDTEQEVVELMLAKGLEQVDIAVMHGAFEYQYPEVVRKKNGNIVHNSARYLELVKYNIFIGHVHHFSTLDRIVAHGSFDRLSQGYEAPKGCVRATIEGDDCKVVFIENKGAMIYKTIDVVGLTPEQVEELLHGLSQYPEGSYFRIRGTSDDHAIKSLRTIRQNHRTFNFEPDVSKAVAADDTTAYVSQATYIPMQISESSVKGQLLEELRKPSKKLSPYMLEACEKVIDGYLSTRLKRQESGTVPAFAGDELCD